MAHAENEFGRIDFNELYSNSNICNIYILYIYKINVEYTNGNLERYKLLYIIQFLKNKMGTYQR